MELGLALFISISISIIFGMTFKAYLDYVSSRNDREYNNVENPIQTTL
jgi:hypothetical protein